MSEFLSNLSTRDKVLFIGGGGLVLFLLVRTLFGGGGVDSGVLIDQSQAAAEAEQEFEKSVSESLAAAQEAQDAKYSELGNALNNALLTQSDNLLAMFDGLQKNQQAEIKALEERLETDANEANETIASLEALIAQMSKTPVYTPPPTTSSETLSRSNSVSKNKEIINKTAGKIMNDVDKNVERMNTNDKARWGSAGDEQTAKNRYYASNGTDKEAARVLGLD